MALLFALLISFPIGIAGGLHQTAAEPARLRGAVAVRVAAELLARIVLILFCREAETAAALGYQGFSYVLLRPCAVGRDRPFIIRTLTTSFGEVMQTTFIDELASAGCRDGASSTRMRCAMPPCAGHLLASNFPR